MHVCYKTKWSPNRKSESLGGRPRMEIELKQIGLDIQIRRESWLVHLAISDTSNGYVHGPGAPG